MPSRHLWLGNVTQKPHEEAVYQIFSRFGRVDSVRIFPAKAYAFVNFADVASAVRAMAEMDGIPLPALTGVKPVVMRFQLDTTGSAVGRVGVPRVQSESYLSLSSLNQSINQLVPGSVPSALSGSGDSSSEDGVGVVPNSSARPGAWTVLESGLANLQTQRQMQRSTSLNLLSGAQGSSAAGLGSDLPSHNGAPQIASLLAMQRGQGLASPGSLPPLGPSSQGFATASQLTTVLNNLTALQRATSGGVHPAGLLNFNLQQPQPTPLGGPQEPAPSAVNDIAHLTSMLAGQSLTPGDHQAGLQSAVWGNSRAPRMTCPLSGQVMADPVIAADGITYDRKSITEWMSMK